MLLLRVGGGFLNRWFTDGGFVMAIFVYVLVSVVRNTGCSSAKNSHLETL